MTPLPHHWKIASSQQQLGPIHSVEAMHNTALARVDDASLQPPSKSRPRRLGRVEVAVLRAIDGGGGLIRREEALLAAYPGAADQRGRALAHAGLSRALLTLERKGLIVKERDPSNTTTLLFAANLTTLPEWEQLARAEEDLAAHCGRTAAAFDALARRARSRARSIRTQRSADACDGERNADLATLDQLTAP